MRPADDERLRRWRLVLGQPAAEPTDAPLTEADLGMDRVLEALYDTERKGGLGPSSQAGSPARVARASVARTNIMMASRQTQPGGRDL